MRKCLCVLFLLNVLLHADNNRFFYDDWSTHQPVLHAVAISTEGSIIEFGCGYGSTDLLHEICERDGRLLITVEDNQDWLNKFATKYKGSEWHKFFYVPGKNQGDLEDPSHWIKFLNEAECLKDVSFDVCFIDQSPWLARYETLKKMKDMARFVIVHDVDYFPENGIFGTVIKSIKNRMEGEFSFDDVFTHFRVYFPNHPWPADTGPPTLLGSNFDANFPPVDYSKEIIIHAEAK